MYSLLLHRKNSHGPEITQSDRDFISRIMSYYSCMSKGESCPKTEIVTAELRTDIQGAITNRNANDPVAILFKAAKYVFGVLAYIHFSVDASPFYLL